MFQDPYEVYNPFYRVKHIFDMVVKHLHLATNERRSAGGNRTVAARWSACGGKKSWKSILTSSPAGSASASWWHARIMLKPSLIVADEPVSAVDASLRAMILDVMIRLRDEAGDFFPLYHPRSEHGLPDRR